MILANPNSLLDLDEVTEKIKNVKNVSRVYQISGEYKIAIFMVATSYKELKENLKKYILPLGEAVINLLDDKHCLNRAR
ncbi:MAG: Lrp/AsnC ligand binding domain-containing protein [Thermoplasmata archaeon]|nr:Lrp/AsnC ligand binding domain-containing protein [Thermoplasmata archaeon]